ncbi:MAG: zf-HC2 domain-containing protein [Lachnospiraceae bacterium]|jgi:hypothetical protein|nr:zf-HC2 domain-containing protein [Lachnospiraceae bacterium]
MDCKLFTKQIPGYLDNSLATDELAAFLFHMEACSECEEELAIYYLANEGLLRLEDGGTFNLKQVMTSQKGRALKLLRVRRGLRWLTFSLLFLIAVAISILFYLVI